MWFVIRGIFKPFEGLLGLLAVTMMNPGEIWPVITAIHIERLLVLVTAIGMFLRPEPFIYPKVTKRLFVFWAAMFVSIPLSYWPGGALSFCLDFGRIILYHFLIANLVDSQKKFLILIIVFAVLIGWVAGGALWGYMHGSFDPMAIRNGFERATGLTESNGNPNTIGLTMVSGLPIVVLLLGSTKWQKLLGMLITLAALAATVLTGSRTGFANLCILSLLFMFNRRAIKFLPFLLLAAIVTWVVMPQQYKDRYSGILSVASGKKNDESYEAHRMAREAGYAMIKDYPITGVGAGQFPIADGQKYWPGYPKLWENPHNLYIQLPAELGIIGVAAWLSFVVPLAGIVFRLRKLFATPAYAHLSSPLRNFPRACLFSLGALLIGGMFGHVLYRHTWYMLAGMIVALERTVATTHSLAEEKPVEADDRSPSNPTPIEQNI
jgi:O-antigen ligase